MSDTVTEQEATPVVTTPPLPKNIEVPPFTPQTTPQTANQSEIPSVFRTFAGEYKGVMYDIPVDMLRFVDGNKVFVNSLDNVAAERNKMGVLEIKIKGFALAMPKLGEKSPLIEIEDELRINPEHILLRQRMYLTKSMIVTKDQYVG